MQDDPTHEPPSLSADVDDLLRALDAQMGDLQLRHGNVFALANAWAERHDAIVAATPGHMRMLVEARLRRIGRDWGMVSDGRVTAAFRALDAVPASLPAAAAGRGGRASVQSLASLILGARRHRA